MVSTRRAFLRGGLCASVCLAGCSSRFGGTATPTEEPPGLYELSGEYVIPAGEYRDLALDVDEPALLDYTVDVRSGPNLDVLVLARGEFREYARGDDFERLRDASALDTSYADVRAPIDPIDVNVVFDNTDRGAVAPPGEGEIDLSFELTVTSRSP